MRLDPINLYDYEARAKQVLSQDAWNNIDAGAMDEVTYRRNRSAFEEIKLRPRFLRNISDRCLSTTVLGTEISIPVMLCPAGAQISAHPDGELAAALGAQMSDTLMMLSTDSGYSIEEVAEVTKGPLWFELIHEGHEISENLVRRAEESGYKAICLSIDDPIPAPKEKDIRYRKSDDTPNPNMRGIEHLRSQKWTPPLTWKELEWLRSLTSLPLVLKGVMTAEDARLAVKYGVNGILVSNHGGRQFDMMMSSIETLPEVVEAVNGRVEIYLDGGIRRGSDVLKALTLGARAVAIGRPLFWGLAVGGAEGVHGVLEILRKELDRVMAYCGQTSMAGLEDSLVNVPVGWG